MKCSATFSRKLECFSLFPKKKSHFMFFRISGSTDEWRKRSRLNHKQNLKGNRWQQNGRFFVHQMILLKFRQFVLTIPSTSYLINDNNKKWWVWLEIGMICWKITPKSIWTLIYRSDGIARIRWMDGIEQKNDIYASNDGPVHAILLLFSISIILALPL